MNTADVDVTMIEVPEQRVTSYFDQEIYEEFKRTIARSGVIEPIVLVSVGEKFFLVDGLHRLQEATAKGDQTIRATVIPGEEKDIFLTNLFLNVMRGKPKVSEMRQVIETLRKDYKMSAAAIEKRTGLSKGYIDDLVAIGRLPEEILTAFDGGTLSKGAALALTRLSGADLQLSVFDQIAHRDVTVQDIEDIVHLLQEEQGEREPAPPREKAPPAEEATCDGCYERYDKHMGTIIRLCPACHDEWVKWWSEQHKKKESAA